MLRIDMLQLLETGQRQGAVADTKRADEMGDGRRKRGAPGKLWLSLDVDARFHHVATSWLDFGVVVIQVDWGAVGNAQRRLCLSRRVRHQQRFSLATPVSISRWP